MTVSMETLFDCIIDGHSVTGPQRTVINPATAREFARCSVADAAMVDRAVAGALRAQREWCTSSLDDRRTLLATIADTVEAETETLARLLVLEQGKVLREAVEEVELTAYLFRHYATIEQAVLDRMFEDRHDRYLRVCRPLGVTAAIVPWNYPLLIVAMKVAPALLTGNALVVKPAPTTPLTTLHFGRICVAHVPPGLMQVIADDGSVGAMLTQHPDIRKIAFTGSTATGARVMQAAAATLKRMTLELGGNDAAILLDDCDLPATAAAVHTAAFSNAGQICGAVKRIYVSQRIHDDFCSELGRLVAMNIVGNGFDPLSTMGPVQNALQFEKAMRLHDQAKAQGSVIATASTPAGSDGFFVPPTLFGGLADEHELVSGEQFAPLLPILPYAEIDEAVRRANAGPYGLTASVWSADRSRALDVARQLDASAICINAHNDTPFDVGIALAKQSGSGWLLGEEGMREYLETFTVML